MGWRLLADLLVVLHLAFAAFVVCGGFLAWRWRWLIFVHAPALAWGFWVETSGQICPLTPLENHLRRLAGEAGYQGGFLDSLRGHSSLSTRSHAGGSVGARGAAAHAQCRRLRRPAPPGPAPPGSLTISRPTPQNSRPFAIPSHGSPVAQSVERRTVNPLVVGSSPTRGAITPYQPVSGRITRNGTQKKNHKFSDLVSRR